MGWILAARKAGNKQAMAAVPHTKNTGAKECPKAPGSKPGNTPRRSRITDAVKHTPVMSPKIAFTNPCRKTRVRTFPGVAPPIAADFAPGIAPTRLMTSSTKVRIWLSSSYFSPCQNFVTNFVTTVPRSAYLSTLKCLGNH